MKAGHGRTDGNILVYCNLWNLICQYIFLKKLQKILFTRRNRIKRGIWYAAVSDSDRLGIGGYGERQKTGIGPDEGNIH